MRHAVLALLLLAATHATRASAAPAAAADDAEARRLVEAAADALGRLPAVAFELRTDDGNALGVLREAGVGLQATTPNDGVLVMGETLWAHDGPGTPWKQQPVPAAEALAFVAEMDTGAAPLSAEGVRALLARSVSVARVAPSPAPAFAAPAAPAAPDAAAVAPCTVTAIALVEGPGPEAVPVTIELQLCAEDARLLSTTARYPQKDGSVRIEHARYLDAGTRRLTRP